MIRLLSIGTKRNKIRFNQYSNKSKSIINEEKYKKMTPIEHVLNRPGRK